MNYSNCFERESGYCSIGYYPTTTGTAATPADQGTFGLSLSTIAAKAGSAVDSYCSTDYLSIPGGSKTTTAPKFGRICGRFLNTNGGTEATISVKTKQYPFIVGVTLDANEQTTSAVAVTMSSKAENGFATGGIVGFDLYYIQATC
jgi:hypothetical protein